jgi:hypothetical protein
MLPSENPYASPQALVGAISQNGPRQVSVWLRGAASGLIVTASLETLVGAWGLIGHISNWVIVILWYKEPFHLPSLTNALKIALLTFTFIRGIVILIGSWRMRKAESYRSSVAAAILASCGVLCPMLWFSAPFGIWALVILIRKDTRAAFTEAK